MAEDEKTVVVKRDLWPATGLDPWSTEAPDPSSDAGVLFVHKGKLLLNVSDRYYSGGFTDGGVQQLLQLCAQVLLSRLQPTSAHELLLHANYVSFKSADGDSFCTVRDNGTIGVAVSDDHYSGDVSADDAFKLALMILSKSQP